MQGRPGRTTLPILIFPIQVRSIIHPRSISLKFKNSLASLTPANEATCA